jgi:hypothetical protein
VRKTLADLRADKIVELCAGTNAVTRIERARSTELIEKLSKILDPFPVSGECADTVGGRYTGYEPSPVLWISSNLSRSLLKHIMYPSDSVYSIREAAPSHFGVVYRFRSDTSPEHPAYVPPPGSGSLYGLLFTNSSASRPTSPPAQKSSPTSRSDVSFDSIIEDHSAGRTNLANRFKSSNRFDAEHYNGIPSCSDIFISNPKRSCIAAQLAYEHQEPEGDSGDWVEEVEDIKVKKKTTRSHASASSRETRTGRRSVKFFGSGAVKAKEDSNRDKKPAEKNKTEGITENDCASVLFPL